MQLPACATRGSVGAGRAWLAWRARRAQATDTWPLCALLRCSGALAFPPPMLLLADQEYDWRYFMASSLSSTGGLLLIGGASWAVERSGRSLPVLPGFAAPATSPERFLSSRKWSQAVEEVSRRQLGSLQEDAQFLAKG